MPGLPGGWRRYIYGFTYQRLNKGPELLPETELMGLRLNRPPGSSRYRGAGRRPMAGAWGSRLDLAAQMTETRAYGDTAPVE